MIPLCTRDARFSGNSYYQSRSFNAQPYNECFERWSDNSYKHYSRYTTEADCTENGGTWATLNNFLEKDPSTKQ